MANLQVKFFSLLFLRIGNVLLIIPFLYRYHIQDFNTNDLMALVLPYHESRIFAKVLQLVNLNLPTSRNFVWLNSIKKEGIHLSKLVLVNHLISDSSFLRFVCDTFLNTLKVSGIDTMLYSNLNILAL